MKQNTSVLRSSASYLLTLLVFVSVLLPLPASSKPGRGFENKHWEQRELSTSHWDASPLQKSIMGGDRADEGPSLRDGDEPNGPALGDEPLPDSLGFLLLLGGSYALSKRRNKQ